MFICKFARPEVVTISENASLEETAKLMKKENVGSVVLVKDIYSDTTPVGIITDRDMVLELLAEEIDPKHVSIKDLVINNLMVVQEKQSVHDTLKAMVDKGVRRAPVINEHGKLVGIVSLDDLLVGLVEDLYELVKIIKKQAA